MPVWSKCSLSGLTLTGNNVPFKRAFVKAFLVFFQLSWAANFTVISTGNCRSHQLWPITDITECTNAAAATLSYKASVSKKVLPIPHTGYYWPEGCFAKMKQGKLLDVWLSVSPDNRGNGFHYSKHGFGRYPICKGAPDHASSEKGLYCSKHFKARARAIFHAFEPNSHADQECLTFCWASPRCWGCSAFCSKAGCIWHALEECGELVRALGDNHQYPVSWMPGKAEPVQKKTFQKVTWNLLIVVYSVLLGTVLMCWLRPWDLVNAWRQLGPKILNVYAVCVSPLRVLQALCVEDSRSDTPVGRKVQLIMEERRHAAAMVFSSICVGVFFLHVLRAVRLSVPVALQVDLYATCCQSKDSVQEAEMLAFAQSLAPLLFLLRCSYSRKHGTRTTNLLVWGICLAKYFSQLHAHMSQTCNAKPYTVYGEAAFRCFLLICIRPGRASIVTIVLSIVRIMLVTHNVPAGSLELSSEHCHGDVQLSDLKEVLHWFHVGQHYFRISARNAPNTTVNSLSRIASLFQTLWNQDAHANVIYREVVIAVIVIVTVYTINLTTRQLLEQSLHLQNTQVELRAVSKVLSKLCDAVVHLDSEFQIAVPSPKLRSMLHAAPNAVPLHGSDFCSLLASEGDRNRLIEALGDGGCHDDEDSADNDVVNLQVGMHDSCGIVFQAEVFHTHFQAVDGEMQYVLGINEVGERLQSESVQASSGEPFLGQKSVHQEIQSTESDWSTEADCRSDSTCDSFADEMPFWFECNKQHDVVQASPSRNKRLFHILCRNRLFNEWITSMTTSMLKDDAQLGSGTGDIKASFHVEGLGKTDKLSRKVTVQASYAKNDGNICAVDDPGLTVRFEVVSIEAANGAIDPFWFDIAGSGEMVSSSLDDDVGKATCMSRQLLDDALRCARVSSWLQRTASELCAGLVPSSRSITVTAWAQHSKKSHKVSPYKLTLFAERLQSDESEDLDSRSPDLLQMVRVTATSIEKDRSVSPKDRNRGTPVVIGRIEL